MEPMTPPPSMGAGKGGAPTPPPDPSVWDRLKGVGSKVGAGMQWAGDRNVFDSLAMGFNSMRMNPSAAIDQVAAQRMQARGQQKRQQAQANRTAEYLRSKGRDDLAQMIERNPALGSQMLLEYQKSQLNPPDSFVTVKGSQLGMAGENADRIFKVNTATNEPSAIGGGGTNINMGDNYGTIPPGYEVYETPEGGRAMRLIKGSPQEKEILDAEAKQLRLDETRSAAAGTVVQDLQRMYDTIDDFAIGENPDASYVGKIGGAVSRKVLSSTPGTPEYAALKFKESALSNVGLDTLMQMKFNSPTGGALGQVPVQQQARLEQVLGSLDLEQDIPVLRDNIKRIQNIYNDVIHGTRAQRMRLIENGQLSPEQNAAIESLYQPLSFDAQGRKINTSTPPDDFPQNVDWKSLPEDIKLKVWTRKMNENGFIDIVPDTFTDWTEDQRANYGR